MPGPGLQRSKSAPHLTPTSRRPETEAPTSGESESGVSLTATDVPVMESGHLLGSDLGGPEEQHNLAPQSSSSNTALHGLESSMAESASGSGVDYSVTVEDSTTQR